MLMNGNKKKASDPKGIILHNLLKKFAVEVSPVQPEVVTQFERNYLGLTKKDKQSGSKEIPDKVLLNSAKFRNRPLPIKTDEVSLVLCKTLMKSILFRTLSRRQLLEVICVMKERRVQAGEIVLKGFEKNNKFFVVEHGIFRTWSMRPTTEEIAFVTLYKRMDYFGEMGLIYDVTNDMSVQAVSDGILWYIERDNYNRILLGPSKAERDMNRKLIGSTQILRKLLPQELDELVDYFYPRIYEKGEFIFFQNDPSTEIYVAESGKIMYCIIDKDGSITDITPVKNGDIFGESAITVPEPRLLSVYAKEKSRVLVISVEALEQVIGLGIRLIIDFVDF